MISLCEIKDVLNNSGREFVEQLAQEAGKITRQYFGRTISLYAPLYLSNHCSSHCTYCGFHSHHHIQRFKLTAEQMRKEMTYLADCGIEQILLLTGESYKATPLSYLKEAVNIAKDYFSSISLEIHPMETEEYKELFISGADGITIYQETYNPKRYREVHLAGKKADYDYRFAAPQRAADGGIRHLSMGILLGLSQAAEDLHELYKHVRWMEQHYPGVEYSVSFPRLRPIKGSSFAGCDVDNAAFIKIICLTRIYFPRVGINLSTRENPHLRDHALELGITRISAGSNTAVGGYTVTDESEQNPQFDIQDKRGVQEIIQTLKQRHFDPVLTDWRRIPNE